MSKYLVIAAYALFLALTLTSVAEAITLPRPSDGMVTEYCLNIVDNPFGCNITVTPTIAGGEQLPKFKKTKFVAPGGSAPFEVKAKIEDFDIVDFDNLTIRRFRLPEPGPQQLEPVDGAVSDLKAEAIFFDDISREFVLGNVFGTVLERGAPIPVSIPDLFADTNGDGNIGSGDTLYSLVDLNVYLDAIPIFSPGQSYNIVNGEAVGLPGMRFSTSPFSFDSDGGFFTTGILNTTAIVAAQHDVAPIPEPSSLILMLLGTLSLLAYARLRERKTVDDVNTKVTGRRAFPDSHPRPGRICQNRILDGVCTSGSARKTIGAVYMDFAERVV